MPTKKAQPEKKTTYREDGSIERERWYLNGKEHREDGPAWIEYHEDSSIAWEYWYLNGKELAAWRVRQAKAQSSKTPVDELIVLLKDKSKIVREAARARFTKEELEVIESLQTIELI